MDTNSAVEVAKYEDLENGDIFIGTHNDISFLGMKVATEVEYSSDKVQDILLFSTDKNPPALFNAGYLGRNCVAKMKNLTFLVYPQKPAEMLFDLKNDNRVRSVSVVYFWSKTKFYLV